MSDKKLKVTLVKSVIGTKQDPPRHCAWSWACADLNSSAVLEDTPAVRGMITKVRYLVKSERLRGSMELNTIKPGAGAKHAAKRVGRGIGCGLGKTCRVVVTRVRSRVPVASTRLVSKAVRCRCNVVCRSVASCR